MQSTSVLGHLLKAMEGFMKKAFFACMLAFAGTGLFAQAWDEASYPGVELEIGVDSDAWDGRLSKLKTDNNVAIKLPQGKRVTGGRQSTDGRINNQLYHATRIMCDGNEYEILTSNLRPLSDRRLPVDWITIPWRSEPNAEKKWVVSYYLDILRSQDRGAFLQYERAWVDWATERARYEEYNWYDSAWVSDYESLVFFDAVVFIGGLKRNTFFITGITPLEAGYKITMSGDMNFALPPVLGGSPSMSLPFPPWSERRNFDMLFIPDGDYMDVYLDSIDNHFAIFAKVDAVMLEELHMLMRTNTVDLSKITSWPRRADGSTDYPPPDGTTVPDFQASQKTHGELALPIRPKDRQSRSQTTDRLRVREKPDTGSAIVTTLDTGTHVQLLETGATETIGGITAPWVKVQSENGFTGWTFSGYLETLNPETQNLDSENQERENVETQNETGEASLLGDSAAPNRHPLNQGQNLEPKPPQKAWRIGYADSPKRPAPPVSVLPFAITGGVILVAGIVTTVVLAKRKKGKAAKP